MSHLVARFKSKKEQQQQRSPRAGLERQDILAQNKKKKFSSSIKRLRICSVIFPISDTTQIPLLPGDFPCVFPPCVPKAMQCFPLPCPSLCSSLCHYGSRPHPGIYLKYQGKKETIDMRMSSHGHLGPILTPPVSHSTPTPPLCPNTVSKHANKK